MKLALSLARKAQGNVEPNPMVGAVIVRDGVILGQGYHRRYGQAHAEVNALTDAQRQGHDVAGADMYVTLEPCSHHGKTPPCADAVVRARIGRVFCAMVDPFTQVAGRGIAKLRDQGIEVHVGLLEAQARELNAPFIKRVTQGLPFVMLKWAQSIDGKIASAGGDSQWISGPKARRLVHQWRSRVDVVMVGIGTALADDPQLTARDVKPKRIARRVVIDRDFQLPDDARVLDVDVAPVTLAISAEVIQKQASRAQQLTQKGVEIFPLHPVAPGSTEMDLRPLMEHLSKVHQASNVLVEGGGRLHGSLIRQKLADQLRVFVSPRIIGDARAPSGIAGLDCPSMKHAMTVHPAKVTVMGDDVLLDYNLR